MIIFYCRGSLLVNIVDTGKPPVPNHPFFHPFLPLFQISSKKSIVVAYAYRNPSKHTVFDPPLRSLCLFSFLKSRLQPTLVLFRNIPSEQPEHAFESYPTTPVRNQLLRGLKRLFLFLALTLLSKSVWCCMRIVGEVCGEAYAFGCPT